MKCIERQEHQTQPFMEKDVVPNFLIRNHPVNPVHPVRRTNLGQDEQDLQDGEKRMFDGKALFAIDANHFTVEIPSNQVIHDKERGAEFLDPKPSCKSCSSCPNNS